MIPDFSTLEMQTLHSEPLENVKGEAFNTPEEWEWWFNLAGYNGDYSLNYFE